MLLDGLMGSLFGSATSRSCVPSCAFVVGTWERVFGRADGVVLRSAGSAVGWHPN